MKTFFCVVMASFLSACSTGITSNKEILTERKSDKIANISGLWAGYIGSPKGVDYDNVFLVKVIDRSTGYFGFLNTDNVYEIRDFNKNNIFIKSILSELSDQKGIKSKDIISNQAFARFKGSENSYASQICELSHSPTKKCFFLSASRKGEMFYFYLLTDETLSANTKILLGDLYTSDSDKGSIHLTDSFISENGSKFIELISRDIPKNGSVFFVFRPITEHEATVLALKQEEKEKEREERKEKEAKKAEEERILQEKEARLAEEKRIREEQEAWQKGLMVCNHSYEKISLAYRKMNNISWQTHGWYNIDIGQCKTLERGIKGQTFYIYAEGQRGSKWGGKYAFCIDPKNAFTITDFNDCDSHGYKSENFLEIKIPKDSNEFTQDLTGGKLSKIDGLDIGERVYVQGFLSDELAQIVRIDKSNNTVKVMSPIDGTATWVNIDQIITKEEALVNDIGRATAAAAIIYCLFDLKECKK